MEDGLLALLRKEAAEQPVFNSFKEALEYYYQQMPDKLQPTYYLTREQWKQWQEAYKKQE